MSTAIKDAPLYRKLPQFIRLKSVSGNEEVVVSTRHICAIRFGQNPSTATIELVNRDSLTVYDSQEIDFIHRLLTLTGAEREPAEAAV